MEKAEKFWCYRRQRAKSLLHVLALCVLPNFRYSSKCFAEIYKAQYGNAMLVYIRGTPIWRLKNSINIWNLLWLTRRLIFSTEQTSIYVSPFPNNITSKKARNHEISIFLLSRLIRERRAVKENGTNQQDIEKRLKILEHRYVQPMQFSERRNTWEAKYIQSVFQT